MKVVFKIKKSDRQRYIYLDLISYVDNEGIWDRLNSEPTALPTDLQASHIFIRQEKGHSTRVRVWGETQCKVWLGTLGVVIHPQACPNVFFSTKSVKEGVLFQTKVHGEYLHQLSTKFNHFTAILSYQFPTVKMIN